MKKLKKIALLAALFGGLGFTSSAFSKGHPGTKMKYTSKDECIKYNRFGTPFDKGLGSEKLVNSDVLNKRLGKPRTVKGQSLVQSGSGTIGDI